MAHGEMIMIGAYTTYMVQNLFISFLGEDIRTVFYCGNTSFVLITGFVGYLLEISIVKRLYGRTLDSLLATWGISLILQQLARNIFGAPNVDVRSPRWLNGGVVVFGNIQLPYKRLFIILLAALCIAGVYLFLFKSDSGRRIRAVMQNRSMAEALV